MFVDNGFILVSGHLVLLEKTFLISLFLLIWWYLCPLNLER